MSHVNKCSHTLVLFSANAYQAIPPSPKYGILQWLEDTKTLKLFFKPILISNWFTYICYFFYTSIFISLFWFCYSFHPCSTKWRGSCKVGIYSCRKTYRLHYLSKNYDRISNYDWIDQGLGWKPANVRYFQFFEIHLGMTDN